MFKYKYLLFILCSFSFLSYSQIPDGYYNSAIGKKRAELKTALHLKIKTATVLNYGGGEGKTWSGFVITDVRPSDGKVWDMYSDNLRSFNGNLAVDDMNIEHSFPKSWWGGTETQAYKDLHHLNPSDAAANQRKSNYIISVIDDFVSYTNNVIKVGKTKKKDGMVLIAWEPADIYKGDFARAYMYMVTAYQDYAPLWTGGSENQLDNNTYPVFEKWTTDLLLDWIKLDPISQKEINRNNEIFKIQGNRNPFIDYPQMAEYVWGNKSTIPFTLNGIVDFPFLNYPDNNDSVKIGQVYFQNTANYNLALKATNINDALNLTVTGNNASNFLLDKYTISQSEAQNGTNIQILFNALSVGSQNANLTISGGGIQPIEIKLNALVIDEFVALPATFITHNGFKANWTKHKNTNSFLLDVFALKPTEQTSITPILQENFNLALPNTWIREGWTDNTLGGTIKLGSANNYGKLILPTLNISENTIKITIKAKQFSNDDGAKLTATLNNQSIAEFITSVNYQDFVVYIPKTIISSTFALSTAVGKRIYIDNINVDEIKYLQSATSVSGYPKQVDNVTEFSVTELLSDSCYYYSVKPNISGALASTKIKVRTELSSGLMNRDFDYLHWNKTNTGIVIHNTQKSSKYMVYNLMGKCIQSIENQNTDQIKIDFAQKGIYIVQIITDDKNISMKVAY